MNTSELQEEQKRVSAHRTQYNTGRTIAMLELAIAARWMVKIALSVLKWKTGIDLRNEWKRVSG